MNTPNNKRRKDSRKKIESAFVQLLQNEELSKISVTDICKAAQVNRTTFYANYIDIYDLAQAVQKHLEEETIAELYCDEYRQKRSNPDLLKLFYHIKENPLFYKTYFKLNAGDKLRFAMYDVTQAASRYGNKHIDYHIEFFRSGLNAVIKKWLENDCRETPEDIFSIITEEYQNIR